ncbi:site-specific DNA-methyltransferase [Novispirillum itersonii]|uniref:site-specific DNA-methyltransferase (adenine-specific) n=1 Tax=Novispirillum itersonii TaxID=189 RepID=A0A7W9ZG34_NOVIT|nr:site-specific DNA-methyltransferase [Novispirillum itersonii]MBB6210862.1 adenine-specific DNA-methyltransferase [Novispirillum itersonii]
MPSLNWIGKEAVEHHHKEVPYRLVHCDGSLSAGDPDAGNLLVQGDNLEALKALLPYYGGQVKCIYIDPPFNTGAEDWIYNDNSNDPQIRAWLGKYVGDEASDLSRHDKWLCMMYPRARLLRDFLRLDGTLFLHIDDNELAYSIALFDEIFGRHNRLYVIAFKQASATGHKAINPGCVNIVNHIIIYAKSKAHWTPNRVFTGRERDKRYSSWIVNPDAPHSTWKITTLMNGFAAANGISLADARKLAKASPELIDDFVLENASSVCQLVTPDYNNVGQDTQKAIDLSTERPSEIFKVEREGYSDIYLKGGKRILFYRDKIKIIDGVAVSGEPLTTLWDDLLSNNIHNEGGVPFPKGKKPEALLKRCFELATSRNSADIVMDSFCGSGTTAAVAMKMGLRFITVEMGEHAESHAAKRLRAVVSGEDQSGVSRDLKWRGGSGFRYCRLGVPLFNEFGDIDGEVSFPDLAAHIFFAETGAPIPTRAQVGNAYLGKHGEKAVYLLYAQGQAGMPREALGNVLTPDALVALPPPPKGFEGTRVVYAEGSTVSPDRLKAEGVMFKQIPYQIEGV